MGEIFRDTFPISLSPRIHNQKYRIDTDSGWQWLAVTMPAVNPTNKRFQLNFSAY